MAAEVRLHRYDHSTHALLVYVGASDRLRRVELSERQRKDLIHELTEGDWLDYRKGTRK